MSVKESLKHLLLSYKEAKEDGDWALKEVLQLVEDTAQTVSDAAGGLSGDDAEWERLVQDVEEFVEEYVVPFDIPGVGVFFERFIDSQLSGLVRPLMEELRPK